MNNSDEETTAAVVEVYSAWIPSAVRLAIHRHHRLSI